MNYGKHTWVNGRMIPTKDARVSNLSHSLHYGWAPFEGVRFYNTSSGRAVFRLGEHIDRFLFSIKTVGIEQPYSKKDITEAIIKTVRQNGFEEGYIRPLAFYGEGIPLDVPKGMETVQVSVLEMKDYFKKALRVMITNIRRLDSRTMEPRAKISGYYMNSIFAMREAHKNGFDEALLCDTDDNIAEGPGENFFMVKHGTIVTPSLGSILPGITRDSIMVIARKMGLRVVEKKISPKVAKQADEAFFTGTAVEITPVIQIDRVKIGDGEKAGRVTLKLKEAYADIVRGGNSGYTKWLTAVD